MTETIPSIREVRTVSESENFNPTTTTGVSLRAEIDISKPVKSVQEMVTGFDCRGSWVPFKIGDNHDNVREFNIRRMEKQAAELEKDLIMKELETLDFLEALGSMKKIVKDLKLDLHEEHIHRKSLASQGLTFMDLDKTRMNLGKTMNDLAMIQSYVEFLNIKTEEDQDFHGVASLAEELNSLRLKPSGQCEEIKMVTETNDTTFSNQSKTCLKTAEMRLVAARKMEEAARATEALAIAEITILSSGKNHNDIIFPEPPRPNLSRTEILVKLEEANEEVKTK